MSPLRTDPNRATIRSMIASIEDVKGAQSRIYRLDPARFAVFRRRLITRSALGASVFLGIMWYLDERFSPRRDHFDYILIPAIMVWTCYQMIRRERDEWTH